VIAEMEEAKAVSLALRIVALALSVAAAIVMGTASELIVDRTGAGSSPTATTALWCKLSESYRPTVPVHVRYLPAV
jgi:hypothetical protein